MREPHRRAARLLLAVLVVTACGDRTTPPPPPPVATSVTISPASVDFHSLGDTEQLSATVRDQNGHVMAGAPVNWTTVAAAIASASPSGLVTAQRNGTTTVTASSGTASASVPVTVTQRVARIRVSPSEATLLSLGDTVRLLAEGLDANGNPMIDVAFTWMSDDESIVTVGGEGLATAVGNGTATVSATAQGFSADVSVKVEQRAAEVLVSPATSTLLSLGDTLRLSAKAFDANGNSVADADYLWSSSDDLVATVDSTGLVTATGWGTAVIRARTGGAGTEQLGTGTVSVRFKVGEVRLAPATASLPAIGDTVRLTAVAYDEAGTLLSGVTFGWESSDELVAAVDSDGLVTGVAPGHVTVTASIADHSSSASITVAETVPYVALVADTLVRSGAAFEIALTLDMRRVAHIAGAVAVAIVFDSTLLQFESRRQTNAQDYWASLHGPGEVRIVVSAPGGLRTPSTLATLPFRAIGADGSRATLSIQLIQAIAAGSYDDISSRLATRGRLIRIRP